eukprot:scaffold92739_cov27-Tisochrysis_lutea.AAC.2
MSMKHTADISYAILSFESERARIDADDRSSHHRRCCTDTTTTMKYKQLSCAQPPSSHFMSI